MTPHPALTGPPPKHHMALMIWLAVFPTLTVLHLLFHRWLQDLPLVLQTLVLSALVVLTVVYVLMPRLQRARGALLARTARRRG
ncbi:hypothetical protein ACQEVS_09340 [Streptomyces sp. CA-181903]|uniref:hypothetical protein n=1 Tax=Streptomyces sp. CA-181903 TaxID=3240055 RepID=UPI003D929C78